MREIHNGEENGSTNETKHLTFKNSTSVCHPIHTVVTFWAPATVKEGVCWKGNSEP